MNYYLLADILKYYRYCIECNIGLEEFEYELDRDIKYFLYLIQFGKAHI